MYILHISIKYRAYTDRIFVRKKTIEKINNNLIMAGNTI